MNKKRKLISGSMILFELRNVVGNPFIHIFGIGMPIFFALILPRSITAGMKDSDLASTIVTSFFLATGSLIPLATVLIGYAASCSQELEKGIPQRMELFGISKKETLFNRAISEGIFMLIAFAIYVLVTGLTLDLKKPVLSGVLIYALCMIVLGIICFILAHGIANLFEKFGPTYCVTMLLYFGFMALGGMMGIGYDQMSKGMQTVAKMLPMTYISRDFVAVWTGKNYNFMPMIQSYLFLAAISGILLFIVWKKTERKVH